MGKFTASNEISTFLLWRLANWWVLNEHYLILHLFRFNNNPIFRLFLMLLLCFPSFLIPHVYFSHTSLITLCISRIRTKKTNRPNWIKKCLRCIRFNYNYIRFCLSWINLGDFLLLKLKLNWRQSAPIHFVFYHNPLIWHAFEWSVFPIRIAIHVGFLQLGSIMVLLAYLILMVIQNGNLNWQIVVYLLHLRYTP